MLAELTNAKSQVEVRSQGRRRNLYDVLFSPLTATFALLGLTLTFLLPADGLGITICWFKSLYGLPCPGCGLTRSLTCISQLQFAKAWSYHPFGPLIYALFVANALLLLIPRAKRGVLKRQMADNDRWLRPTYLAIVASFLAFGVLRILLEISLA